MKLACSSLLSIATLFVSVSSGAVIDFDNVASGTVINNIYFAQGVTFSNPLDNGDIFAQEFAPHAASNPNVVSVFQTGAAFDARWGAVQATFSTLQRTVSIDAAILRVSEGLGTPNNYPKLEVYDASNNFITAVPWDFVAIPQPDVGAITGYQTLQYTSSTSNIGSVRLLSGQPGGAPSNFGLFDNLRFEAAAVPEPGTMVLLGVGLTVVCLKRGSAAARRRSV